MSIRHSLTAILNDGPSYGYRLRAEFEQRTGGVWPINIGQVYSTLDRLERDGLVAKGETDAEGHVYYELTAAGRASAGEWFTTPVVRDSAPRSELAMKLAIASTLPDVDVAAVIQVQRTATMTSLHELTVAKNAADDGHAVDELAGALVLESLIFATEAELRWLDHSETRLARARAERS
jgi:DNA-binding PadR family transcriptional regulator